MSHRHETQLRNTKKERLVRICRIKRGTSNAWTAWGRSVQGSPFNALHDEAGCMYLYSTSALGLGRKNIRARSEEGLSLYRGTGEYERLIAPPCRGRGRGRGRGSDNARAFANSALGTATSAAQMRRHGHARTSACLIIRRIVCQEMLLPGVMTRHRATSKQSQHF